jgi:hypothetical protein
MSLTVRLLETGTGTASSVLLWLTSTGITDKKVTIIIQKGLSQLVLAALVNILGMVSDNSLGNSGTDGVNLGDNSTSLHTDTNIKVGEFFLSEDKDGLEGLQAKRFGLNKLNGLTIDLNKTTSLLGKSTGSGGLFPINTRKDAVRQRFKVYASYLYCPC